MRLDSFMDRNKKDRRRYFVSGDLLTVYPLEIAAGTYTLWYAPSAPVLSVTIDLPVEMERWREMIEVASAIKLLTKREMGTEGLERQFSALKKSVEDAASSRMAEPAQVPMHGPNWGGGFWDVGYPYGVGYPF